MKQGEGRILRREQEIYLEGLLPPRDALLREMEERAEREEIPISDPEVGRLLQVLARASGAQRIIEVGAAIGYGTLCLARGAPTATVLALEIDRERIETARGYLERAGVASRVELHEGAALELLQHLPGPFDLAYLDAVKQEYRRYLDLLLPRMRVGGLVVADNLLWGGSVAEPRASPQTPETPENTAADQEKANAMRAFNAYLMSHPQLDAVVLPLGDGVGVATKTRPLRSEAGGPWL